MPCLPVPADQSLGLTGMVSFGDSLSDLGNTTALLTETEARVLAGYNSNFYYDGRFSDGPIWSERLYGQLGFGTMVRNDGVNFLEGTNFSYSGTTSGTGSVGILPNLITQIGFYSDQLKARNPALPDPSTTLFTVWSGGNDASFLVEGIQTTTPEVVAGNIAAAVTNLYNLGGRSFLVGNLPPLGLKPDFAFDPIKRETANEFVDSYNILLANELNLLSANLPGIRIDLLDAYSLFSNIIASPAAYGFTNVTDTAYTPFPGDTPPFPYGSVVPNPDQYLFWDNSHGTIPVSELLASEAYQAVVSRARAVGRGAAWARLSGAGVAQISEMKFAAAWLALVLAFPLVAGSLPAAPADLLVLGHIRTMSKDAPVAEAMAVSDGKIIYVGDAAGAGKLLVPGEKTIQLKPAEMVLPGIVDSHVHPLSAGLKAQSCVLDNPKSKEELLAVIAA